MVMVGVELAISIPGGRGVSLSSDVVLPLQQDQLGRPLPRMQPPSRVLPAKSGSHSQAWFPTEYAQPAAAQLFVT